MTPEQLQQLFQAIPDPSPPFYRLYHNADGVPLFYSMTDEPGTYIEISQEDYHRNASNVRVRNGKLVEVTWKTTTKLIPGLWEYGRPMTKKESAATLIVELSLDRVSAKARTGEPTDDDEDIFLVLLRFYPGFDRYRCEPFQRRFYRGVPTKHKGGRFFQWRRRLSRNDARDGDFLVYADLNGHRSQVSLFRPARRVTIHQLAADPAIGCTADRQERVHHALLPVDEDAENTFDLRRLRPDRPVLRGRDVDTRLRDLRRNAVNVAKKTNSKGSHVPLALRHVLQMRADGLSEWEGGNHCRLVAADSRL